MDDNGNRGPSQAVVARPRLLESLRAAISARHYSPRTGQAYLYWIRRFIVFSGKRHPRELGAPEITAFLSHLAVEAGVAAATQNQALAALLFLYKEVMGEPLPWLDDIVRAKRPVRKPTVLTFEEVSGLLANLRGPKWLMASLLYGAGLRLRECLTLRIKDVDFGYQQILVRDGIRTVQELLGHSSVETTMIYTHVMNKGGRGVKSPLDRAGQRVAEYRAG